MPRTGIVGEMRIGDMALLAVHGERAGQRAAPADLDHVAERIADWSARRECNGRSARRAPSPIRAASRVPLTAGPSSSPVIRKAIEPFGLPPCARDRRSAAAMLAGEAALHVDGAAAPELAIGDFGRKGG